MLKEIEKEKKKLKRQIEHRRHKSVDLEGITQSSDVICKFRNLRKVHSAADGLAPCPVETQIHWFLVVMQRNIQFQACERESTLDLGKIEYPI